MQGAPYYLDGISRTLDSIFSPLDRQQEKQECRQGIAKTTHNI